MKHLLSTLLLSCTFIAATAMDETNGNPSSMNVSEADSLRTELPSVQERDFELYKDELLDEQSRPEFDIYKQYLLDILDLETDIKKMVGLPVLLKSFLSLKNLVNDNNTPLNSFQDYCKWLETETDNWNLYIQYWMYKNNKKENPTPKEGIDLLHEYTEYVLNKKALKAGEKAKTVSEAFEEYKKERYPGITTTSFNYIIYAQFFKDTCSLTDDELQFFGIEMSCDYYSRYLKNTAPTNVDSEDSTDVDTIDPSTAIDWLNSTSSDTTIVDLLNSTSSDTTKQQQQVTTYKEPSAQKQLFIDLNTANKRKHDELDQTMEPQAKNVKRLHDIMQNLDEVFTQIKEKNQPVDIEAAIIDKNGKTRTLSFCFSGEKQPQTEKNNQKLLKKTTKHS